MIVGHDPVAKQADFYAKTADHYDIDHFDEPEHENAIGWLRGLIWQLGATSLLDVGAGTGRVIRKLGFEVSSGVEVVGIEPVRELRERGHAAGVSVDQLIEGDGRAIPFPDHSFDIVCEFAVLHHVAEPAAVVAEMLRVARLGIFISDENNFGCGNAAQRVLKQTLDALGLWRAYQYVRTGGRGYRIGRRDGLRYSYSVYNNYDQIRRACRDVLVLNTSGQGVNPYRSCSHVALFGRI